MSNNNKGKKKSNKKKGSNLNIDDDLARLGISSSQTRQCTPAALPPQCNHEASTSTLSMGPATNVAEFIDKLLMIVGLSGMNQDAPFDYMDANIDKLANEKELTDALTLWADQLLQAANRNNSPITTANLVPYFSAIEALGYLLLQYQRANRRTNIEVAITAHKLALRLFSMEQYPTQYAMSHNNLGNAFCVRINGSKRENIETAIFHYNEALKTRNKDRQPRQWAMTRSNIALAYRERLAGNREENLKTALLQLGMALAVYRNRLEEFELEFGTTNHILASVYTDLYRFKKYSPISASQTVETLRANRNMYFDKAIESLTKASELFTANEHPGEFCKTQECYARLYLEHEDYDTALEHLERVFEACDTPETNAEVWASTVAAIATTYLHIHRTQQSHQRPLEIDVIDALLTGDTPLERAASAIELAVALYDDEESESSSPQLYAQLQLLSAQISLESAVAATTATTATTATAAAVDSDWLKEASKRLQNARRIYTVENSPLQYATLAAQTLRLAALDSSVLPAKDVAAINEDANRMLLADDGFLRPNFPLEYLELATKTALKDVERKAAVREILSSLDSEGSRVVADFLRRQKCGP